MILKLTRFLTTYPKSIIFGILILSFISIYPASRIETNFDLEGFFPENDVTLENYLKVSEWFGRDDNVTILAFRNDSLLSKSILNEISNITMDLSRLPYVDQVQSITTASQITSDQGELTIIPYVNLEISSNELKQRLLSDNFVRGLLIDDSATFSAIYIGLNEENNTFWKRQVFIDSLQIIIDKEPLLSESYVSGIPYFRNGYVNALNKDIPFYMGFGTLLISIILWFLFHNIRDVILPLLIVWLTVLFTITVIQITGGHLEILSSTIISILLCVGVADSVHLLTKYYDGIVQGLSKSQSIKQMLTVLGIATLLTSTTTAIGFASLSVSNVIPMKNFGIYTAIGVIFAFILTILLLPSVIYKLKQPSGLKEHTIKLHLYSDSLLERLYHFSFKFSKQIIVATSLLVAFFTLLSFNLKIDSYIYDDVSRDSKLIKDSEYIAEQLFPQFPLEIIIDSNEPDGIFNPNVHLMAKVIEQFLISVPEIKKVYSYRDVIEVIHNTIKNDNTAYPYNSDLLSQYNLMLEISSSDHATQFTDFNYRYFRITALTDDIGSYRINEIREELQTFINERAFEYDITLSGTVIMVADMAQNIVYSLNSSILLAVIFISIILYLMFRDIRKVAISLLPNIFPLLIIAGVMGLFNIKIRPSTAIIFTISFGIVIDDTIHYLSRLKLEMENNGSVFEALRITTIKTGRAIIITSIILLAGFGMLGFSNFESTRYFGLLTSLTILVALYFDLVFLPAILNWYYSKITE